MACTRILLADDDRDHLTLIKGLLTSERQTARVTTVSNRIDFLEAIHAGPYDCVIVDYNLPPYTAPDLLRDLDRYQPGVPRIVVSSSEEQRVVIDSVRQGAADFVQKHEAIGTSVLWDRIDAAIGASRAERIEKRAMDRRLRALERRAQLDPLTGVLNRHGAELALGSARRQGDRRASTTIIFVDLDHFKRVNDHLGHNEGDRILREAAAVLSDFAKGGGIVARWGGEEFLLIRQSDSLAQGWIFGDRIRRAISERVRLPEPLGPQTASVGVDVVPSSELSVDIVRRADQAMYLAKEGGRNRVCTYPMVRAIDAAHECASLSGSGVQDCVRMTIERLWSDLGQTQREHTGVHGRDVRDLTMRVAKECAGKECPIDSLRLASENHDVGKVGVPEDVLALPRGLTADERRFINEHAKLGAEILRACGGDERAAAIVERHHARYDQRPHEASSDSPDPAEIVCACDAAVTIMSGRPYAPARSREEMLAELSIERGRQFHPKVIDAMHRVASRAAA